LLFRFLWSKGYMLKGKEKIPNLFPFSPSGPPFPFSGLMQEV
jgi:hypothetical protein